MTIQKVHPHLNDSFHGFHLLEILITLVIIGILIMVSLPTYLEGLTQAKRLEAATSLSKLALALEQYYVEHHTYEGATFEVLHFPTTTANDAYRLAIQFPTTSNYQLTATPQGMQSLQDKLCGVLRLSGIGEKKNSGPGKLEDCW